MRDTIVKKDTDIQNLQNALRSRAEARTTTSIIPTPKCQEGEQLPMATKWQSEDRTPADLIPATHPMLEILLAKVSFSKD